MSNEFEDGVVLPEGQTGSSFFYDVLTQTASDYSRSFSDFRMSSSAGAFKTGYGETLARFELARLASPDRVDIACSILDRTQDALGFSRGGQRRALGAHLMQPCAVPELKETSYGGSPGLSLSVPFEGRTYRGAEVLELAALLRERHHITDAVADALNWMVHHAAQNGGRIDLRGHRFAIMGAGAELAPTRMLQHAGATVLWIDVNEPRAMAGDAHCAGSVVTPKGGSDLLKRPEAVAAAIRAFAADGPVHVGMFAYAAGESQEWRLAATMNAIVRSLPPEVIESVAMFVSPTTVARAYPEAQEAATFRTARLPGWQRALQAAGALSTAGHVRAGDHAVSRAVVSVQGVSYQAAQYISKVLAAEVYANYGTRAHAGAPTTVSANVAGITRTRSLSHPVFQAAFSGAPAFDVKIFDPPTTRALSGLLIIHDLLNPQAPGARTRSYKRASEKADAVLSQQVHGGVYALPFALEPAIRVAAVLGMAKNPRVLWGKPQQRASRPTPAIQARA